MARRAAVVAGHVLEVVIDRQIAERILLNANRGRERVQHGQGSKRVAEFPLLLMGEFGEAVEISSLFLEIILVLADGVFVAFLFGLDTLIGSIGLLKLF